MEDLFFPMPLDNVDSWVEDASFSTMESMDTQVLAQRNPVADPYLGIVYGFDDSPQNTEWLLSSGWANMPETDRDGFVAAILDVYPTQVEALQTLYMNAFGRLGDPEGLAYWTLNMLHTGTTDPTNLLLPVINESPEYVGMLKTALGNREDLASLKTGQEIEDCIRTLDSSTQQGLYGKLIDNLYENIFGRVADAGGKAYWTSELEQGHTNLLQIMGSLINGAGTTDKVLLETKGAIAYDAVQALVDHNVITSRDITQAGTVKIQAALSGMQERLSEYDSSEISSLWADKETLIGKMLQDAGLSS